MASRAKFTRLAVLILTGFCLAGVANASFIVNRPVELNADDYLLGGGTDVNIMLAASWSQQFASDGSTVSALGIRNAGSSATSVDFQLFRDFQDVVSGGTEVRSATPVTVNAGETRNIDLWSGLSLEGGVTYYLIASTLGDARWLSGAELLPGDPNYPDPAFNGLILNDSFSAVGIGWTPEEPSELHVAFAVQGTLRNPGGGGGAETPEPATLAMLGAGLTIMGAILRRRRSA